jgi:hypothetical protein
VIKLVVLIFPKLSLGALTVNCHFALFKMQINFKISTVANKVPSIHSTVIWLFGE